MIKSKAKKLVALPINWLVGDTSILSFYESLCTRYPIQGFQTQPENIYLLLTVKVGAVARARML
jgi:hypothetical protein